MNNWDVVSEKEKDAFKDSIKDCSLKELVELSWALVSQESAALAYGYNVTAFETWEIDYLMSLIIDLVEEK